MPAPRNNKNAKGNKGGGRKATYQPAFAVMARKIARLGATDKELADILGVSESTLARWKRDHVEFLAALKEGKTLADATVADRLYQRAIGYKHKAVKILTVAMGNNQGSEVQEVPYIEHYPPDTTAAIFWLKNRRPNDWRDKQAVEHSGTVTLADLVMGEETAA